MADLKDFAEQLVNLTVKEVNELADILKDEYGIEPAAAAVAVAAGGGVRHFLLPVSPDFTCLPVLVICATTTMYCHQVDDPDVVNFLLQTEIIPLCLRIMETGSELSKTVSRELQYHPCPFFSTRLTPDGRVLPNNTGGDLYCAKDSAG